MLNLGVYNIVESINTMVFGNNKFRIRRYEIIFTLKTNEISRF